MDFLVEQIAKAGQVSARKMFGEYGIYCTARWSPWSATTSSSSSRPRAASAYRQRCGAPLQGAKPCFLIPGDQWDDADWLARLIAISAAELPITDQKTSRQIGSSPQPVWREAGWALGNGLPPHSEAVSAPWKTARRMSAAYRMLRPRQQIGRQLDRARLTWGDREAWCHPAPACA